MKKISNVGYYVIMHILLIEDGKEGLGLALTGEYAVMIIDRMLPSMDGLSVIAALRTAKMTTPLLIWRS